MQAQDKSTAERQNKGPIEKKIIIETCRDCKSHRSSTWHDEAKYEANFKLVKAAIEALTPEVEVIRKVEGPFTIGGFEITHGSQLIYSKKNSGLWPNAKAVAQRVKTYFEDLEAGKNVSNYGKQKEKAYVPKRVPGESRSTTSTGFHTRMTATAGPETGKREKLVTSKTVAEESAGGSPAEDNLDDEDQIKTDDHNTHHKEKEEQHTEAQAQAERVTPPQKVAEHAKEETKQETHHAGGENTPKEEQHKVESNDKEKEHHAEEGKTENKAETPATQAHEAEVNKDKAEAQPVATEEKKKEEAATPVNASETHEKTENKQEAAGGNSTVNEKETPKEKTEAGSAKLKTGGEEEYAEDFS